MTENTNQNDLLLVIDAGNTNITFGIFEGEELAHQWRIQTDKNKTSDQYGIELEQIMNHFSYNPSRLKDIIIASVVPDLMHALPAMCRRFMKKEPIIVGEGTKSGIPILLDNPREVGADRVVNAVAGFEKYGGPLIIVDIGTAITHDVISAKGAYLGGVISPGIGISSDALFMRTSKLPKVELIEPRTAIGKNTVQAMQAGIVYGFIGLIDNISEHIIDELASKGQGKPTVVATGGYSALLAQKSKYISTIDKDITLQGLRIIYERTMEHRRKKEKINDVE